MNKETTYVVFCLYLGKTPVQCTFTDMTEALEHCQKIRNGTMGKGYTHVSMCSDNVDQIGGMGVDSVVDGKLPDGGDYTWIKRRNKDTKNE